MSRCTNWLRGYWPTRPITGLAQATRRPAQFVGLHFVSPVDKTPWPELGKMFPVADEQPPHSELIDRLMFAQANEAARCLEEGVLRSVADGPMRRAQGATCSHQRD